MRDGNCNYYDTEQRFSSNLKKDGNNSSKLILLDSSRHPTLGRISGDDTIQ